MDDLESELFREIATQQATIIDQGILNGQMMDEIETLKAHIKESRDLTDKDLIADLRHQINVRNEQLLTAGQEDKVKADDIILKADRIAFLEGKLKALRKELDAAIGELLDANPI